MTVEDTLPKTALAADFTDHLGRTLGTLMLAGTSFGLMQSLLVPALPALRDHLGAGESSISWVLTAFLLSSSVLTPVVGRAGDLYGKQRVLVIVLAVFSVGILVSALADTMPVMLAGRVIQGIGGGVFPLAFGIVRTRFAPQRIAGSIGAVSSVVGIGGGLGLVLPGIILDELGIRWLFWIPLILNIAAMATVACWIPRDRPSGTGGINLLSAALISAGLVGVLISISELTTWKAWSLIPATAGLAFLAAWVVNDLRSAQPLIDISVMRIRSVWAANLAALFIGAGMFGSFLLIPLFVQTPATAGFGFGASLIVAGLFMIPTALPQLLVGPFAGSLERKIGNRGTLLAGATLFAASFAVLATADRWRVGVLLGATLIGFGLGLAIPALANVTVDAIPPEHTGAATAVNTVVRNIGGALGSQVAATLLTASAISGAPRSIGYTVGFAVLGSGVLIAILGAFVVTVGKRTA